MNGIYQHAEDDGFNKLDSPHDREHRSFPSCQLHFNLICDSLEINTFRFPLKNRAPKVIEWNITFAKSKQIHNHLRVSGCHSSRVKSTFIVIDQLPRDRCIILKNMKQTTNVSLSICTKNHHIIRIQYVSGNGNTTGV